MRASNTSVLKFFLQKAKPAFKVFGSTTWLLTKIGIVFVFAGIIGGMGMGTGMIVGALEDVPAFDPTVLEHPSLPSYIYDINGDLITEIHDAQNRIPIKMDDVPDHLRDAFLAAEDKSFFENPGFDLRGIARAVYTNIVGGGGQGGSTITQQIAKQVYLSSQKSSPAKSRSCFWQLKLSASIIKTKFLSFISTMSPSMITMPGELKLLPRLTLVNQ